MSAVVETPDRTYEIVRAEHFYVDDGNLYLANKSGVVAMFAEGQWICVTRKQDRDAKGRFVKKVKS